MAARGRVVEALESLEGWLDRLPGPARDAVKLAIDPLRTVLIELPEPAFVVIGGTRRDRVRLGGLLAGDPDAPWSRDPDGWWAVKGPRGVVRIVDLDDGAEVGAAEAAPLDTRRPHAVLALAGADPQAVATVRDLLQARHGGAVPVVGLLGEQAAGGGIARVVDLRAWRRALEDGEAGPVDVLDPEGPDGGDAVIEALVAALPEGPGLAVLRAAGRTALVDARARELVQVASAAGSAVAATPLPVADSVPLAALQLVLVLGIARLAGRPADLSSARELLGAAGVQLGGAMAFRETARALVKLLPGWGGAISAGIAWAGTQTVGEAAIAWFVHGMPQRQVQRLLTRRDADAGS